MNANPKGIAVKIKSRLGTQLVAACSGTLVPDSFLAGLISVESAGDPNATRFEKGVFAKLQALRNPLKFWRSEWNGIAQADVKGLSDEALINLSTSFGYTQVMGWWAIVLPRRTGVPITVADIRDPQKHLTIAVRLLHLNAARYLKVKDYGAVLRIWNTGSAIGKTYDPNYVDNALAVKQAYSQLT
jgi:hypothetical protein